MNVETGRQMDSSTENKIGHLMCTDKFVAIDTKTRHELIAKWCKKNNAQLPSCLEIASDEYSMWIAMKKSEDLDNKVKTADGLVFFDGMLGRVPMDAVLSSPDVGAELIELFDEFECYSTKKFRQQTAQTKNTTMKHVHRLWTFVILTRKVQLSQDSEGEKTLNTTNDGLRSTVQAIEHYHGYVHSLPPQLDDPLHWKVEELQGLLSPSNLYNEVVEKKAELEKEFSEIVESAQKLYKSATTENADSSKKLQFPETKLSLLKNICNIEFPEFLWARSIQTSRAFGANVKSSEEYMSALLPLIDIFNHKINMPILTRREKDDSNKAEENRPIIDCSDDVEMQPTEETTSTEGTEGKNKETGAAENTENKKDSSSPDKYNIVLTLTSGVTLKPGNEVFQNYDDKSNEELLMGYGFTLPENPFDCIQLKQGIPKSQFKVPIREIFKELDTLMHVDYKNSTTTSDDPDIICPSSRAVILEELDDKIKIGPFFLGNEGTHCQGGKFCRSMDKLVKESTDLKNSQMPRLMGIIPSNLLLANMLIWKHILGDHKGGIEERMDDLLGNVLTSLADSVDNMYDKLEPTLERCNEVLKTGATNGTEMSKLRASTALHYHKGQRRMLRRASDVLRNVLEVFEEEEILMDDTVKKLQEMLKM